MDVNIYIYGDISNISIRLQYWNVVRGRCYSMQALLIQL